MCTQIIICVDSFLRIIECREISQIKVTENRKYILELCIKVEIIEYSHLFSIIKTKKNRLGKK